MERGDRGRQGTGLGLAITQGMIGAHGGSVEALPGYDGRGTTIRIIADGADEQAAVDGLIKLVESGFAE